MSLIDRATEAHRNGRLTEAEELYRRSLEQKPRNFDALHMLGLVYSELGLPAEAERSFRAALSVDANFPPLYHNFGLFFARLRKFEQAIEQFDQALIRFPSYAQAHSDRGVALQQLGRVEEALQSHSRAVALASSFPIVWCRRGVAYSARKDYEAALKDFDQAIKLDPKYADAWMERAGALFELGRYEEALSASDAALGLKAGYAEAWNARGRALLKLGRCQESIDAYDHALQINPSLDIALIGRAHALVALRRFIEALPEYEKAATIDARSLAAWHGLGNLYDQLGRFGESQIAYRHALDIDPSFAGAWNGLGFLFWRMGQRDESFGAYDRAIELDPNYAEPHFNKAVGLLTLGRFAEGCAEYEWREKAGKSVPRPYKQRRWDGSQVGGTLLVWGEQGVGDHVLYSSLFPDLLARAGQLTVETDPRLVPLFARSFPSAKIVAMGPELYSGDLDVHVPMGSLLRHLRSGIDAFPKRVRGHLVPDEGRVAALRKRFEGRPVVGISWFSGNREIGIDKSASLLDFESIFRIPDVCVVDLQYGDTSAERQELEAAFGVKLHRLDDVDNMNDLDGLAALIRACDRVLSVSNTTVHLAGAVGTPTCVMVPPMAGRLWYWFENVAQSPWYPNVHVVRRDPSLSWKQLIDSLVPEMRSALGR